jgi:hypothetical protein
MEVADIYRFEVDADDQFDAFVRAVARVAALRPRSVAMSVSIEDEVDVQADIARERSKP